MPDTNEIKVLEKIQLMHSQHGLKTGPVKIPSVSEYSMVGNVSRIALNQLLTKPSSNFRCNVVALSLSGRHFVSNLVLFEKKFF